MTRLALLLLLAGCVRPEPHWRVSCAESHPESKFTYMPGAAGSAYGVRIGGGMVWRTEIVCDRYDSTWVVPRAKP